VWWGTVIFCFVWSVQQVLGFVGVDWDACFNFMWGWNGDGILFSEPEILEYKLKVVYFFIGFY